MKFLLLIGGLLGFAIGLGFSWAQESAWPASLWHACIAAYAAAMLMRWWGRAWRKGLEESLKEQQKAAAQTHSTSTSATSRS